MKNTSKLLIGLALIMLAVAGFVGFNQHEAATQQHATTSYLFAGELVGEVPIIIDSEWLKPKPDADYSKTEFLAKEAYDLKTGQDYDLATLPAHARQNWPIYWKTKKGAGPLPLEETEIEVATISLHNAIVDLTFRDFGITDGYTHYTITAKQYLNLTKQELIQPLILDAGSGGTTIEEILYLKEYQVNKTYRQYNQTTYDCTVNGTNTTCETIDFIGYQSRIENRTSWEILPEQFYLDSGDSIQIKTHYHRPAKTGLQHADLGTNILGVNLLGAWWNNDWNTSMTIQICWNNTRTNEPFYWFQDSWHQANPYNISIEGRIVNETHGASTELPISVITHGHDGTHTQNATILIVTNATAGTCDNYTLYYGAPATVGEPNWGGGLTIGEQSDPRYIWFNQTSLKSYLLLDKLNGAIKWYTLNSTGGLMPVTYNTYNQPWNAEWNEGIMKIRAEESSAAYFFDPGTATINNCTYSKHGAAMKFECVTNKGTANYTSTFIMPQGIAYGIRWIDTTKTGIATQGIQFHFRTRNLHYNQYVPTDYSGKPAGCWGGAYLFPENGPYWIGSNTNDTAWWGMNSSIIMIMNASAINEFARIKPYPMHRCFNGPHQHTVWSEMVLYPAFNETSPNYYLWDNFTRQTHFTGLTETIHAEGMALLNNTLNEWETAFNIANATPPIANTVDTPIINNPPNNTEENYTSQSQFNITVFGSATDGYELNVSVNGGTAFSLNASMANASYTLHALNLSKGAHSLNFSVANDDVQNHTLWNYSVLSEPTTLVQSVSPASPRSNATNLTFSANYTLDKNGSIIGGANCDLILDGISYDAAAQGNGLYNYSNASMTIQTHAWYFNCTLQPDNYTTQTGSNTSYEIYGHAVTLAINNPANNTQTTYLSPSEWNITVTGTAGLYTLNLSINDATAYTLNSTLLNNSYTLHTITLGQGEHELNFTAYNGTTQNSTAYNYSVTSEPTSLSVSASPASPQYQDANVTWTANYTLDTNSSSITGADCKLLLDGQAYSTVAYPNTYRYSNSSMHPGTHAWQFNCSIEPNNYSTQTSANTTYNISAHAATTTINTPADGSEHYYYSAQPININLTATGTQPAYQFNITVDGILNVTGTITNNTHNVSALGALALGDDYNVTVNVWNHTLASDSITINITREPTNTTGEHDGTSQNTNITFTCNYTQASDNSIIPGATVKLNLDGQNHTANEWADQKYRYSNNTLNATHSYYCIAIKAGYAQTTSANTTFNTTGLANMTINTTQHNTTYPTNPTFLCGVYNGTNTISDATVGVTVNGTTLLAGWNGTHYVNSSLQLAADTYQYTCNATHPLMNPNSTTGYVTVSKGTPDILLLINGANASASIYTTTNLTVTSNSTIGTTTQKYDNQSVSNPYTNLSHSVGVHNATAIHAETQNYSFNQWIWQVTVISGAAPAAANATTGINPPVRIPDEFNFKLDNTVYIGAALVALFILLAAYLIRRKAS